MQTNLGQYETFQPGIESLMYLSKFPKYICIHTYIHTHIYIYTHTLKVQLKVLRRNCHKNN